MTEVSAFIADFVDDTAVVSAIFRPIINTLVAKPDEFRICMSNNTPKP